MTLQDLIQKLNRIFQERDWHPLHSPKNLAMNLHVEAGELAAHFTWLEGSESYALSPTTLQEVKDEMGDVLINLLSLSDVLGIDLLTVANEKLDKIALKYPVK